MHGLLGIRRAGWWLVLLFFVLLLSAAGCGSDGEAPVPSFDASGTTVVDPVLEVGEFGIVDSSVFTDVFLPEITEDDIEVLEGDVGTSYRYVFPTRELSDGVSFDLEARWDPVDGGLQPSLVWNLTGDETSPSDFAFPVSLPKGFAETVDDITFDPQPDEIIDPDPVVRWEFDATRPVTISAISDVLVVWDRAGGDVSLIPLVIMATLNDYRIHSELSSCARFAPGVSMLISDATATGLMVQCYLRVVAVNASTFGGESCAKLGEMIGTWGNKPAFQYACQSVVGFATGGGATTGCDRAPTPSQRENCLSVMWGLLAGGCPAGDPVEQQICVYDAAVAVSDAHRCDYLAHLGSPEMANDCRAAITKDPSYCAKTADPKLAASCCENFRGTDAYDTCLASTGTDAGEADTTATTSDGDADADEPGDEDPGLAIPAGIYTGSFDVQPLTSHFFLDTAVTHLNTITIAIDGSGSISGDFTAYQTGPQIGCPGGEEKLVGTIDAGQTIGPTLPQKVTVTQERSGVFAPGFNSELGECASEPDIWAEESSAVLVIEDVQDGVLTGTLGTHLPFELAP